MAGRKEELQNNPDQVYFTNSSESYAWYDQSSLSWKTWQRSLITDWTSFSESFPKQGTMQNGQLYLQVHWEPPQTFKMVVRCLPQQLSDVEGINEVNETVQYKNGHFFRENKVRSEMGSESFKRCLQSLPRNSNKCETGSEQLANNKRQTTSRDLYNCYQLQQRGITKEDPQKMESGIWSAKHTRRLDPNWRSYVSKPILPRGSYGLSNRVDRTKALGNSIVPAVAAIPLQRVHDLYYK